MPAPVLRGVGLATAATVAVTGGAVALTGTGAEPPGEELALATQRGAAALVPSPVAAVVPAPVAAPAPPTAGVLDTGVLSDAVARAQDEARRLADDARAKEAQAREAEARAERAEAESEDDDGGRPPGGRAGPPRRAPRRAGHGHRRPSPTAGSTPGSWVRSSRSCAPPPQFLGCAFGEPTVLGVAGRSSASDHPRGRALDFMVDRATGDRLAACAIRHREELGISYVIWRQRIDTGSGFRLMSDRGGATANHFDHVHISFKPGAGSGPPGSC